MCSCVCVCVYWSDFMSVSVCMHAWISLSCDWLNDFLKGCRATISFWHLITVRSHCAPADPLWYGPCTCPSPLSQVPIIIIKTPPPPSPPTSSPSTDSSPTPEDTWWLHSSVVDEEESLILPSLKPVLSKLSSKYSSEQKILTFSHALTLVQLCKGIMTVGTNGFWMGESFPHSRTTGALPRWCGDSKRVTWQRLAIWKRPEVKSEPGFQIIFSDWLALTFSEMNY